MEEAASTSARGTGEATSNRNRDFLLLSLLLFTAFVLRAWVLFNTEVPARDTIGFIRYALEFEKLPWTEVLNRNHQHPGYPLALLAVSQPIRHFFRTDSVSMQMSAQLTSALASVLLVIPMFFIGRALFDRTVGFWAALLFQLLPISGHHLSDGISEPLFLCLTATTLWLGLRAICNPSVWRFALCGFFCGLAYLTRPEGALLLGATGAALIIKQLSRHRLAWRNFAFDSVIMSLAALSAGACYFGFTGKFTNKPSVHMMLRGQPTAAAEPEDLIGLWRPSVGPRPLVASVFALTFERRHTFFGRFQSSLFALSTELVQSFHYLAGIPLALGLFWHWRKLGRPESWVIASYYVLHLAVLMSLAMSLAYVSDRHTMALVLCGCFPAAAGMRDLGTRLSAFAAAFLARRHAAKPQALISPLCSCLVFVVFIGLGIPKVLQPLHHNRAGHHAAGLWLAQKVHEGDSVIDDHCWAHYYAGEVFREELFRSAPPCPDSKHDPRCYVVLTRSRDPEVQKQRAINEARLQSLEGAVVFHWPAQRPVDSAGVVVYALPGTKRDLIRGQ